MMISKKKKNYNKIGLLCFASEIEPRHVNYVELVCDSS
jgi:hypothetical protein